MFNILSFLDKDKSPVDPLANRKAAERWLELLPRADTFASHEHILNALVDLRNKNTHYDTDKLDAVMALDEYARPLLATLREQYLRNTRMSTTMETKLWQSIYAFYTEISLVYYSYITISSATPSKTQLDSRLPQITLRVLYDLGNMFKWRFFHYNQADEKLWRMLHKLYRIAETQGFANRMTPLYGETTSRCTDQYVRALLLTQLHPSALPAKQIEMADSWLLKWVRLVQLEKSPTIERHHFCVDLGKPTGASAVTDQHYPDTCLCWDASTLLGQLRRTREELLSRKNPSKPETDMHLPDYLKMLDYVELQWDPANLGKLRKSPRVPTKKILLVIHGFNAICSAIKDSEKDTAHILEYDADIHYAEMVDIQLYGFVTEATRTRQHQSMVKPSKTAISYESWGMEDESNEGYYAHPPSDNNDWLRLSRLVAVKEDNEKHWKIATVRRLFRAPGTGTHVGMEVLGKDPILLMIYTINPSITIAETEHSVNAELPIMALMTSAIENSKFTLIIDSAAYTGNKRFKVTMDQTQNILQLGHVLEKGDAWLHIQASITH